MALALLLLPAALAHAVTYRSIATEGPIELLTISDELNCQVLHRADAQAQMYPSLDYEHGACGTQIAYDGRTFGPGDVPGGNDAEQYVPVSQSSVTGDGTAAMPFQIVTRVMAGVLEITQTDTYVEDEEHYRTDVTVRNTGSSAVSVTVYRFGDCHLHEDDQGYGRTVESGGIACVTHPEEPRPGMLIWMPLSPGSRYFEGSVEDLYGAISTTTPFPSTCDCETLHENAAGLSWTLTIDVGGVRTFSNTTQTSPTGTDTIIVPEAPPPPELTPGTPAQGLAPPPPPESGPVAIPPAPSETPRAIAEACAKRLAGRARRAGTLASSARSGRIKVRFTPVRALRRVRVELRRGVPCSTRGRPIVRVRRPALRAGRRAIIKVRLTRRVKPGLYVVVVSGRQGRRTVRSTVVVTVR